MVQKEFKVKDGYLHIPVQNIAPSKCNYIEVLVDGKVVREALIGIAAPSDPFDFYVPMDIKKYGSDSVCLVCKQDSAKENLFDAIIVGSSIYNEPDLYPDLYKEEIRQQVHFSAARGWLNDPNGLFYKDGEFNLCFQYNPYANHSFSSNICWGRATSKDGVHFKECGTVIKSRGIDYIAASGSAIVDEHNIAGYGKDAVLAVYTEATAMQYGGKPQLTKFGGQMLMYSLDGGATYKYAENNPAIDVPDKMEWRDPKILQIDEKTLAIAVYETFDGENCVSFYKSTDAKNWEFCSRTDDVFECPDLFKLKVTNADEEVWVLYGGNGKYRIGSFTDYKFTAFSDGYIDYGINAYAGQTFNNYPDNTRRIYTAWLCDWEHDGWKFREDEPNKKYGFSQSMALFTELYVVKTENGYRLFRKPIDAIKELRDTCTDIMLSGNSPITAPSETVFEISKDKDFSLRFSGCGFDYIANEHKITTTVNKECQLYSNTDLQVRVIVDTRSVEIFINDEIAMSFDVRARQMDIQCDYQIDAKQYKLKSIWER